MLDTNCADRKLLMSEIEKHETDENAAATTGSKGKQLKECASPMASPPTQGGVASAAIAAALLFMKSNKKP